MPSSKDQDAAEGSMKFCRTHWDRLRQLVIDKGMVALISKDGEAAADRMVEELEGTATPLTYDPLLSAYWMLSGKALELGGLYLMGQKPGEGGEYCPMCEVEEQGVKYAGQPGDAEAWMDSCTDSCLVYCREQGLLPKPQ